MRERCSLSSWTRGRLVRHRLHRRCLFVVATGCYRTDFTQRCALAQSTPCLQISCLPNHVLISIASTQSRNHNDGAAEGPRGGRHGLRHRRHQRRGAHAGPHRAAGESYDSCRGLLDALVCTGVSSALATCHSQFPLSLSLPVKPSIKPNINYRINIYNAPP